MNELMFENCYGDKLYAVVENDMIMLLYSANPNRIILTLKREINSDDIYAAYLASILLQLIEYMGIGLSL